jgi:hypothetical protein
MPFWFLNKKTNAAEIYGSVSALVKNEGLEEIQGKMREDFSRKKLKTFETDSVRIERKDIITTKSKTVNRP